MEASVAVFSGKLCEPNLGLSMMMGASAVPLALASLLLADDEPDDDDDEEEEDDELEVESLSLDVLSSCNNMCVEPPLVGLLQRGVEL
jgi:hypothetical protein